MSNTAKADGCKDCPGAEAAQQPGRHSGQIHVLYQGGPPHWHYLAMQQAIPPRNPNIITKYAWPSIREEDGALVYADGDAPPPRKVSRRLRRASFVRSGRTARIECCRPDSRTRGNWTCRPAASTPCPQSTR